MGSHRNYIGAIERNRSRDVQVGTIVRLAEALDVPTRGFSERYVGGATLPLRNREFVRVCEGGPTAMGALLRATRIANRATIQQLGSASGLHHNYVATLERGGIRSPRLSTIARATRPLAASDETHRDLFITAIRLYAGEAAAAAPGSRSVSARCG
ncbi:hypothetical protein Cwoe_4464 [Conexibacter woesei DSM 14684]|uniref:HTH cro/C1-type domain-containing protein n=2 Tax=Conexibacter TaxID=191494 RepID=D3F7Y3_CONWI|nr:hypothetical protein Cwoe_4464 [Conexibacter woesei DSM 14684]